VSATSLLTPLDDEELHLLHRLIARLVMAGCRRNPKSAAPEVASMALGLNDVIRGYIVESARGTGDFAPPHDPNQFVIPHQFVYQDGLPGTRCGRCGAGRFHAIHQGGAHAR
jgi:hypothetical protein